MKRQVIIPIIIIAVSLVLPSCSGGKDGKTGAGKKPAAVTDKQHGGIDAAGGTHNPTAGGKSVAAAGVKKTAKELIAALPCKLENKAGAFAAFPENTTAGQFCFSLSPAPGGGSDIALFDIKAGRMYFIFHAASGVKPGGMKIMKWKDSGGKPCMEKSCASEIKCSVETLADSAVPGWTYFVLTPDSPADLSSGSGGYYGLVINEKEKYIPLFY